MAALSRHAAGVLTGWSCLTMFKSLIRSTLSTLGWQANRLNRGQVIPVELPEPETYAGPEDFSRLHRPWQGAEFLKCLTPAVRANTMLSPQKLYLLRKLFVSTLGLPGDVFEAGAGSGGSARLMLDSLLARGVKKRMWVLDTFAGYPDADVVRDGQHVRPQQCQCNSEAEVTALLANPEIEVRVVAGRIPATLAQVSATSLCFAHIDVNLHQPTRAATEFCWDRLVPGGVMVFDDYGWPATFGARTAIDEVCAARGAEVICLPETTQAFLIKR